MEVLVYGSGGRDHCLADTYGDSHHVDKVYFAPGNPGVLYTPKGQRGIIERISLKGFEGIADFCAEYSRGRILVGSHSYSIFDN